jgi:hypothetical protein
VSELIKQNIIIENLRDISRRHRRVAVHVDIAIYG